jgi:phenylacetate-CoA ligase
MLEQLQTQLIASVLFPLHERLMKRPTFPYLRELERDQWLSRSEIEALQLHKLNELLKVAMAHCPWHARRLHAAGIDPREGSVTLDDFRRLPTMNKTDARENQRELVWRNAPGGVFSYNTGGSSGEPLIFYFGRARQASDAAGRMRARRWWGVEVGEPEVYLWGAPVELSKTDWVKTVRDRLVNQRVLNAFAMSPQAMDRYLEAIRTFQPACLYGYASSVALLAAHAQARGVALRLPSLKVVCTTGEPLYAHQRALIEQVFGVPAANEFGSRDIGFTAHETPDRQMLLMSESILLEVLDPKGHPVPVGEVGEAVMTGLCSEAQPFIRYRTGDMIRLSAEPCRRGRGLHVIEEVTGRATDLVVRADGTVMHALALIYILRSLAGVAEFKIIQHTVDRVEVQVVPNDHWSEAMARAAEQGIQARLGSEVKVKIHLVDTILPEASGKYRYVSSHVPLPEALHVATSSALG